MTEQEFLQIFNNSLIESPPPSYRLYYNDQGEPLFYTMEHLPGTFIEISQEQFARADSHVFVKDGKLIAKKKTQQVKKLKPQSTGTPCHSEDVCIVVDPDQPNIQWSLKFYDQD